MTHARRIGEEGGSYGLLVGLVATALSGFFCTNWTSRSDCAEVTGVTALSACVGLTIIGSLIGYALGHSLDEKIKVRKMEERRALNNKYRSLENGAPSALVPTIRADARTVSVPDPVLTSSARMYAAPARKQSFPAIGILPLPDHIVPISDKGRSLTINSRD